MSLKFQRLVVDGKKKITLYNNTREIEFHLARGGRWPKQEK